MDESQQNLKAYIDQELAKGIDKEKIRQALIEVGWQPQQIDQFFPSPSEINSGVKLDDPKSTSVQQNTAIQNTPKLHQDDHVVPNHQQVDDKTRRSRIPKIGLVIFLVLLILAMAGAVYGYFFYYMAPERILSESVTKMQSVDTYDYSGSVLMKISGDLFTSEELAEPGLGALSLFTPREFSMSFSGSVDQSDLENIKTDVTFDSQLNGVQLAEVQSIVLGNIYYLKLNNLNTFGLVPVDQYLDRWLFINTEELSEEYDLEIEQKENVELTEEDEERITQAFSERNPFQIIEELENEERSGVETYHYKYKVDRDQLKLFLQDITDILEKYPQTQDLDINELNEVLDGIEFYEGDLWIGTDDYYVYGFTGGMITEIPDTEASLEIAVEMSLDRFNESKSIVGPTEYMTFEELEMMLMSDFVDLNTGTDSSTMESDLEGGSFGDFLQTLRSSTSDVSGTTDER